MHILKNIETKPQRQKFQNKILQLGGDVNAKKNIKILEEYVENHEYAKLSNEELRSELQNVKQGFKKLRNRLHTFKDYRQAKIVADKAHSKKFRGSGKAGLPRYSTTVWPTSGAKVGSKEHRAHKAGIGRIKQMETEYKQRPEWVKLEEKRDALEKLLDVRTQLKGFKTLQPEERYEDEPLFSRTEDNSNTNPSLIIVVSNHIKSDEQKKLNWAFKTTKSLWPKGEHPLEQQVNPDWKVKEMGTSMSPKRNYHKFLEDLKKKIAERKRMGIDSEIDNLLEAKKFFDATYGKINFEVYGIGEIRGLDKLPISEQLRNLFFAAVSKKTVEAAWEALKKKKFFSATNLTKIGFAIGRMKKRKSLKGLRPRLDSSIASVLLDSFEGERGYEILLRLAEERSIIIPLDQPRIGNLKSIIGARSKMIDIESDRKEFVRILASKNSDDDITFIMNHKRIQELLWATERAWKDLEVGDDYENKVDDLQELETFFGQMAYIGKYINENLNPIDRIEVPSNLLKNFGLSYAELDTKYANTIPSPVKGLLKDRVETILANPPEGDEEV